MGNFEDDAMQQFEGASAREKIVNALKQAQEEYLSQMDTNKLIMDFKNALRRDFDAMMGEVIGVVPRYGEGGKIDGLRLKLDSINPFSEAVINLAEAAAAEFITELGCKIPQLSDTVKQAILDTYNKEYLRTIFQHVEEMARERADEEAKMILSEALGVEGQQLPTRKII